MNSFYSEEELREIGFKNLGKQVLVSRKASIYGASKISLGNYVRIDDFCILSGSISIGDYVHVSAYTALYGGTKGIVMEDYSGISARGTVYAESDDYSGEYMTNSMIPDEYRHVYGGRVTIGRYCQVGAGCVILPNVTIGEGAAVGTMSLILKDVQPWTVNVGVPCRVIKERKKELLELEKKLKESTKNE